jgi:hypothetical protein
MYLKRYAESSRVSAAVAILPPHLLRHGDPITYRVFFGTPAGPKPDSALKCVLSEWAPPNFEKHGIGSMGPGLNS